MDEEFLKTTEVAKQFRVSVQTVRNMIADGRLTAVRFGRQYRIPKLVVEQATTQLVAEQKQAK